MRVQIKLGTPSSVTRTVRGSNLAAVLKSLQTGFSDWGKFEGLAEWKAINLETPQATMTITATSKIHMPSWPEYTRQPPACKAEWDRMWAALKGHEDGHFVIFRRGLDRLRQRLEPLTSPTAAQIDAIFKSEEGQRQSEHNDYDIRTNNGASEGVRLNITPECSR